MQAMPAVAEALHHLEYVDNEPALCKQVPSLFSSFVDAFVDYAVGGQILRKSVSSPSVDDLNALDPVYAKLDEAPPIVIKEEEIQTWVPAPKRLVAIGDLHGDLAKARAALQVAEVIDEHDRWVGGQTVVVQVHKELLSCV